MYDGATSLTTAFVVQNRSDMVTISHLQEYFETYQLNPKYIMADQAFMGTEMESYYSRHNIRPISLGPGTHHGQIELKQPFACLRNRSH